MKAVVLGVLAAAALASCGSGGGKKTASPTTTLTTSPEPTVAAGAPREATTGAVTTLPVGTVPAATTTAPPGATPTAFKSPTGNIGCLIGADAVRCDIHDHTYTPPPKPPGCDLDWGDSIQLMAQGPANFFCHGDTAFDPSAAVLPYGAQARQGSLVCTSTEAGISCVREGTANGFSISRQTYSIH